MELTKALNTPGYNAASLKTSNGEYLVSPSHDAYELIKWNNDGNCLYVHEIPSLDHAPVSNDWRPVVMEME